MPKVHIDSLIVDYTESGTGMPVIFIPGITEFKEAFSYQFRGLQDSYRIISYDVRRGLKRSGDYTLSLLAEDLRNFIAALGLNGAVICGHSFGALVAMQFAKDYPGETKALALISGFPAAPKVSPDRFRSWISSAVHPLHPSLGARLHFHVSQLFGRTTPTTLTTELRVAAMRAIARQASSVPPSTVSQRLRIIQKADFTPVLGDIQAPTLVIAGAKDRPFFLSSARDLYEGIPNASLEVIEDSAHFSFISRHDQFNTVLDYFLSDRLAKIS
ncbi:MAG: alpha/beta fold hydrolase [Armatimonadota bacterium]